MFYTVSQAQSQTGLSRVEIIKLFQQLDKNGIGSFKVGRRGWPTRIERK